MCMLNLRAILARKYFPYLISLPLVKKRSDEKLRKFSTPKIVGENQERIFLSKREEKRILLNEKGKLRRMWPE